jgi:hypothetical protein
MATNQQNFRVRNGLTIDGATSGSSSFANPATGSDVSFTLPGVYPAANDYVLASSTTGVLSWIDAGTDTTYTYTASTTTGGANLNLVGSDSTTNTVKLTDGTGVTNTYVSPTEVSIAIGQDVATTATPTFAGANLGNVTVGVLTDQTISTTSGNLLLDAGSSNYVSINNSYNAEPTYITRTTANTNSSFRTLTLQNTTTSTPAVGFGGLMEWQLQTAAANIERAAYINVGITDATAGSEDFRMDFGLMRNGAAYTNKLSLFSTGDLNMAAGGKLSIIGSTSGYTQLGAPATGANITYTLPGADGTSGYVLSTNGSGILSWVANPDTNTTYTVDATATTGGANFNLVGSDSTTDTITFAEGSGMSVVRTDANTITFANTSPGTTYTIDATATTGGANLNLAGSDATTDTVAYLGSGATTITRTDANTITVSSTDTNTTYTQNASATTGGANLNLVGSDSTTDTVTFQSGTNITVAQVDANTINISSSGITPTDVQQVFAEVRNQEGSTITIGQVVYLFGATGNHPTVKLADNSGDATSAKSLGLVYDASINNGAQGLVITQGLITGVNTLAFAEGDALYLGSTPGSVTNVKPYAPEHLVYIGVVVKSNATTGEIFVRVQNGYELAEIHDVDLITNPPTNNQVLTYNATTELWTAQNTQNIFDQDLNTTDNVEFASVKTSTVNTNELRPFDAADANVRMITTGSGTYQTGKADMYVEESAGYPNGIAGVVVNSNIWDFLSDGRTKFPNFTFPSADGTSGQILETDGTGILSWVTPSPANPFDQDLNTTDDVSFNKVTTDTSIQWNGSTSGSITMTAPAVAGTQAYILPDAYPVSSGQALVSDTSGNMSWAAGANPFDQTLNTTDSVQFAGLSVVNGAGAFSTGVGVSVTLSSDNISVGDGTSATNGFTINGGTTSAYTYIDNASNSYNIGVNGVTDLWKFNNDLTTSFPNYTFPAADGTNGQVLETNGTGTLSWATPSGGGSSLPMPPSSSMASNPWSFCPGNIPVSGTNNGITITAQSVAYTPFYVAAPITLTEVMITVATATTLANCNAMIYISEVDINSGWQPTANLSGGYLGEITNITTTGQKTITGLSTVLPAGAYLMVIQFSNHTGTLQVRGPGVQPIIGSGYASASDFAAYNWRRTGVAYVSGTPAAVGNWVQWTAGPSAGISNWVSCKWTVN